MSCACIWYVLVHELFMFEACECCIYVASILHFDESAYCPPVHTLDFIILELVLALVLVLGHVLVLVLALGTSTRTGTKTNTSTGTYTSR
jgi:hypothetical protein